MFQPNQAASHHLTRPMHFSDCKTLNTTKKASTCLCPPASAPRSWPERRSAAHPGQSRAPGVTVRRRCQPTRRLDSWELAHHKPNSPHCEQDQVKSCSLTRADRRGCLENRKWRRGSDSCRLGWHPMRCQGLCAGASALSHPGALSQKGSAQGPPSVQQQEWQKPQGGRHGPRTIDTSLGKHLIDVSLSPKTLSSIRQVRCLPLPNS